MTVDAAIRLKLAVTVAVLVAKPVSAAVAETGSDGGNGNDGCKGQR